MSPNLNGKVCLVTGASQGIGKGIALQLGGAGAIIYITGRNKAKGGENQSINNAACGNLLRNRGRNFPLFCLDTHTHIL